MCNRLGIEAVEAFEEAVRDLEVEGSGWTAAEAHSQLEDDIAVHVRQLEQAKVPHGSLRSAPAADCH